VSYLVLYLKRNEWREGRGLESEGRRKEGREMREGGGGEGGKEGVVRNENKSSICLFFLEAK
jgi:hypothetical protein